MNDKYIYVYIYIYTYIHVYTAPDGTYEHTSHYITTPNTHHSTIHEQFLRIRFDSNAASSYFMVVGRKTFVNRSTSHF